MANSVYHALLFFSITLQSKIASIETLDFQKQITILYSFHSVSEAKNFCVLLLSSPTSMGSSLQGKIFFATVASSFG